MGCCGSATAEQKQTNSKNPEEDTVRTQEGVRKVYKEKSKDDVGDQKRTKGNVLSPPPPPLPVPEPASVPDEQPQQVGFVKSPTQKKSPTDRKAEKSPRTPEEWNGKHPKKVLTLPPPNLKKRPSSPQECAAFTLLKGQPAGIFESWEEDRWPWPWMLAHPPHPQRSTSNAYGDFLSCFKILSTGEVEAFLAWKEGDEDEARSILRLKKEEEEAAVNRTPQRTLSPHTPSLANNSAFDIAGEESCEFADPGHLTFERHDIVSNPHVNVREYTAVEHAKSEQECQALYRVLQACPLFAHFNRDSEFQAVVKAMKKLTFKPDEKIFFFGQVPNDPVYGFHVVTQGTFEVQGSVATTAGRKPSTIRSTLVPGDFFGEYVVTSSSQKSHSDILAGENGGTSFFLENSAFTGLLGRIAYDKRELYKKWLRNIEFLRDLTPAQVVQLADALEEKKYAPNEKIIEFGQIGDYMHFIVEGEVSVWGREKDEDGKLNPDAAKWVCDFQAGHPVGYLEFFEATPVTNIADVTAKECVITARINRRHFERCMGSVKDLLKELTEAPEYAYYRSNKESMQDRNISDCGSC
ncbi:cAMP-dependent protein kinase regulatory subunit [Diplonema papillatum]|nr:cAMP-dependent protein kinase regulatory subunit [Diplonema papillatum]|eukprot:gene1944-2953_t